jgi:hypothetical protein
VAFRSAASFVACGCRCSPGLAGRIGGRIVTRRQAVADAERERIVARLLEMARIIGPDEIAGTARTLERAAAVIVAEGPRP